MSTYIPARLQEASDKLEAAQQEYYVAFEKAYPDFKDARAWFDHFIKHDVERAVESGNPKLYAHTAMDCVIAAGAHKDAARMLQLCVGVDLNEDPDLSFMAGPLRHVSAALRGDILVLTWTFDDSCCEGEKIVAVLRVPVRYKTKLNQRFSAPIGFDLCGAEFAYSRPFKQRNDHFIVSLEVAALSVAASRPMLAAVHDLGERLSRCEGWAPREGITLKDRASEFGLDSGEHEVMVVYKMQSHLPRAFGERKAVLPDVERVEVMPELAWADLARFRIALTEGDCESRMQLLRDLGYEDWGHVEGARYVLTARVGADGSFFSDGSSLVD